MVSTADVTFVEFFSFQRKFETMHQHGDIYKFLKSNFLLRIKVDWLDICKYSSKR